MFAQVFKNLTNCICWLVGFFNVAYKLFVSDKRFCRDLQYGKEEK